jgi:hypothetical protein
MILVKQTLAAPVRLAVPGRKDSFVEVIGSR